MEHPSTQKHAKVDEIFLALLNFQIGDCGKPKATIKTKTRS